MSTVDQSTTVDSTFQVDRHNTEYADYLAWAADSVEQRGIQVRYGEEVVGLTRLDDGTVEVRSRNLQTGEEFARRSRNIILSPGGTPKLPPALSVVAPHPRIIHSAYYLSAVEDFFASVPHDGKPLRIAVIGAGQSSTEVLMDLHSRLNTLPVSGGRKHELEMIFRKGSLKPSDDTPFSNEIFDPATTDMWFNLPSKRDRQTVLREYNPTNYSVVNMRTIDSLYEVMYHQKLLDGIKTRTGREEESDRTRIALRPYTSIYSAEVVPEDAGNAAGQESIRLILHGILDRAVSTKTYHAVFCGTGYDRDSWTRLLASSNLADDFGVKCSNVELVPDSEPIADQATVPLFADVLEAGVLSPVSSRSTDGFSTPPTPATPQSQHSKLNGDGQTSKVRISRNYRLLPIRSTKDNSGSVDGPRIYLQGCTQSTHGLSESLLSILGVRAGLVVDELSAA
ncbi:hypothetical protein BN946_scf184799.g2 [Trametes cinnabarina]|uniref:L-ornithine N(5)-monooxygenase [NAD(P)H] n=1 Tax=Pycnoporus cinnabarinus TaxID=5643 RepID=A0A060S1W4_PYCCI|nr:hypothetical protein BN946_scf184799.g2 [Trametes cinnabarina]